MGIRDRLKRLEERQAKPPEAEYQRPRYLERYFKNLENIERVEAGLEPLPYTEEDREDDRRFLQETMPMYRAEPGWQTEEAQTILDAWEQHVREKLRRVERSTPMDEFKIDPEKYAGLSREEAERRMEEDRTRALMEDPRTIAAFRALDERKAAAEAEERRQAEEARRHQEAEVAAQWEEEKRSRLRQWVDAGGTEAEFEEAWPELRKGILMERIFADDLEKEARARETAQSIWREPIR